MRKVECFCLYFFIAFIAARRDLCYDFFIIIVGSCYYGNYDMCFFFCRSWRDRFRV